jgi:hypothetical protein
MPVILKIVSEYFRDLWNFVLCTLGQITEGAGIIEGPAEDCNSNSQTATNSCQTATHNFNFFRFSAYILKAL